MLEAGEVGISGVLELEVLYSARSHTDFLVIREELRGYPRLQLDETGFARAADVMELLAAAVSTEVPVCPTCFRRPSRSGPASPCCTTTLTSTSWRS